MNQLTQKQNSVQTQNIDYFTLWLDSLPSEHTRKVYERNVEAFAKHIVGVPIAELHYRPRVELYSALQKWVNTCGKSTATISQVVASIRGYFQFLCNLLIIESNPLQNFSTPKVKHRDRDYLLADDMKAIMDVVDASTVTGKRDKAMFTVMYELGLRRSEVVGLRRSDLKRTDDGYVLHVSGKGNSQEVMPVSLRLVEEVEEYWKAAGLTAVNRDTPVFPGKRGQQLSDNTLYYMVERYAKRAGITKKVSPHLIRHRVATEASEVASNPTQGMALTRHKSLKSFEGYVHTDKLKTRREIQRRRGVEV